MSQVWWDNTNYYIHIQNYIYTHSPNHVDSNNNKILFTIIKSIPNTLYLQFCTITCPTSNRKMENLFFSYEEADDDYIDMEVGTYSTYLSSNTREFEFQMSTNCLEKDTTTSPADELFYKGKLLPLHLPPRIQMVQRILNTSNSIPILDDDLYSTPLMTSSVPTPTATSTPFESCQVSRELSPDEYLFENRKKSWRQKLKLRSKLKALKALFGKSGCSDESCRRKVVDEAQVSKSSGRFKSPFGQIQKGNRRNNNNVDENSGTGGHRRSFSMVIKRHSTNKVSSSCSGGFQELQVLKRCNSSAYTEVENSIQGAIAHCKQSSASEIGFQVQWLSERIFVPCLFCFCFWYDLVLKEEVGFIDVFLFLQV